MKKGKAKASSKIKETKAEQAERKPVTKNAALTRIKNKYEKTVFDLKQLIEIGKSLNSTLEYHNLIDAILYTCMAQLKVVNAGLFVRKSITNTNFSLLRNYKGFEINNHKEYSIPENHPLLAYLSKHTKCLSAAEFRRVNGIDKYSKSLAELKPVIVAPMKAKGHINGFIFLGQPISKRLFTENEKEYLLNIAAFAAIAIHNSFLFEMTTTDLMTRLKIKHFFLSSLMELIEEARYKTIPLCLIIIDIDHFKKLNDGYGHVCGDMVLKKVASTIQRSVRHIDIAARYGGDEFTIILPEADLKLGFHVAERIRNNIQNLKITYEEQEIVVTVSIGVAQFHPIRDVSPKAFIDRADKALYMSKNQERNKTTIAE